MKLNELTKLIENVKPYDKGTDMMWTDSYISEQLLAFHLNPDHDIASRKNKSIDLICHWISEQSKSRGTILDLGCGPGLYTTKLANLGHEVSGIDFSESSIAYAKNNAHEKRLRINYKCASYLETDFEGLYDTIIMIYCDFGALSKDERSLLIQKIYDALEDGGSFIIDAYNENHIKEKDFSRQWDISQGGFWRPNAHISLSESKHYPEQKLFLDQHIVMDDDNISIYRFWNHCFGKENIEKLFMPYGFKRVEVYDQLETEKGTHYQSDTNFFKIIK